MAVIELNPGTSEGDNKPDNRMAQSGPALIGPIWLSSAASDIVWWGRNQKK